MKGEPAAQSEFAHIMRARRLAKEHSEDFRSHLWKQDFRCRSPFFHRVNLILTALSRQDLCGLQGLELVANRGPQ
jgi:hypothetical protein